jgi:hypothetical protein
MTRITYNLKILEWCVCCYMIKKTKSLCSPMDRHLMLQHKQKASLWYINMGDGLQPRKVCSCNSNKPQPLPPSPRATLVEMLFFWETRNLRNVRITFRNKQTAEVTSDRQICNFWQRCLISREKTWYLQHWDPRSRLGDINSPCPVCLGKIIKSQKIEYLGQDFNRRDVLMVR